MKPRTATFLLATLITFEVSAHAATPLVTPPLTMTPTTGSNLVGNEVWCYAVNVSNKPLNLVSQVINLDTGLATDTQSCTTAPGHACVASSACAGMPMVCEAYCQFGGGTKRQIRASIILKPSVSGNTIVSLPAQ